MSYRDQTTALAVVILLTTVLHAEQVRFSKQPARAGDRLRQVIDCDLQADLAIQQAGQLIDSSRKGLRRQQDRSLTILDLRRGRPVRAQVDYHAATNTTTQAESAAPTVTKEPVNGKSYLITRIDGELQITDVDGQLPPPEELEIIRANMQTFGLPNPLADFFDGRSIRIGETVSLPAEVARELLGVTGTVGDIKRFRLKLVKTEMIAGARCAVFETLVETSSQQQGHMTLLMKGHLKMEIATCRTPVMSMAGPVAISEIHGTPQAQFTVNTRGQFNVAIRSEFKR